MRTSLPFFVIPAEAGIQHDAVVQDFFTTPNGS
jgi:hypothetical protein